MKIIFVFLLAFMTSGCSWGPDLLAADWGVVGPGNKVLSLSPTHAFKMTSSERRVASSGKWQPIGPGLPIVELTPGGYFLLRASDGGFAAVPVESRSGVVADPLWLTIDNTHSFFLPALAGFPGDVPAHRIAAGVNNNLYSWPHGDPAYFGTVMPYVRDFDHRSKSDWSVTAIADAILVSRYFPLYRESQSQQELASAGSGDNDVVIVCRIVPSKSIALSVPLKYEVVATIERSGVEYKVVIAEWRRSPSQSNSQDDNFQQMRQGLLQLLQS